MRTYLPLELFTLVGFDEGREISMNLSCFGNKILKLTVIFLCNGIRWPLFLLFTSQLTVLINYLCALDTTLRNTEHMIQITCYEII